MTEDLAVSGDIGYLNKQLQSAVVRLFDSYRDCLGATVIEQRLERILGVLFGQCADSTEVLGSLEFVQTRPQRGIRPPAPERGDEADVYGVGQRANALAVLVLMEN